MELLLTETTGSHRTNEYVRISVPFSRGALKSEQHLELCTRDSGPLPLQTSALKRWPDGSVKWLLLDFPATVPADATACYYLHPATEPASEPAYGIRVAQGDDTWLVDTGAAQFYLDARELRPFSRVIAGGRDMLAEDRSSCTLDMSGTGKIRPIVASISVDTKGPLRTTLVIQGMFSRNDHLGPRYTCRLDFFAGSSRVTLACTLHNPRPALHPGGLWDLGDQGSLFIREFAVRLCFAEELVHEVRCSTMPGTPSYTCAEAADRLSLYQESSGGKNWQSPLHRSCHGDIPFNLAGFRLLVNDMPKLHGKRATPLVWCATGSGRGMAVTVPGFWQEFPKEISVDRTGLVIGLLPGCFPDLHELQGGEQHASVIHFDFDAAPDSVDCLRQPLTVQLAPETYCRSGAISDLPVPTSEDEKTEDLIDLVINGPEELLAKRELIDEYGWRNFGEIYADHEAVYHQESSPFISHYSNQYDICAGLYRKYFTTGTPLWGTLAADLARHLLHIDIYHTDQDREEYNHGLFWHTDHYIPAGLATHRSFSREHLQTKDPRFCGGGPGAEHCYTSGLLLHYFVTGDTEYREAVIRLARWSLRSLRGPQTVLAATRKALRHINLFFGTSRMHNRPFPRFPLSRGTGNAINACLDAFEASDDQWFLNQTELLINGTLHPADDIDARDLLDAEAAWSYTVMLVAVARYLDMKYERGELDEPFKYARSCLLSYAHWMVQHEYPYLDKPEILEYPTETWPAQDLRKSVILYHAARYAPAEAQPVFLEKAQFFYTTAKEQLLNHPTSSYTRPVALMLQNGWVGARLSRERVPPAAIPDIPTFVEGRPTPAFNLFTMVRRISSEFVTALRCFSLAGEFRWLNLRLQSSRYKP